MFCRLKHYWKPLRRIQSSYFATTSKFKILGIETSCDDTGCAIIDETGTILGEALNSQERIHMNYGGIIPPIARDLHEENIQNVVDSALKQSKLTIEEVDAIATTMKPGLPLSLIVGMKHGKHLCKTARKPFIPIHHMEAHALTVRMVEKVDFPFLVLLISGGHCIIALVEDVNKFYRIGESLDDAPGEAFDKVARRSKLRNLVEYRNMSGGRIIEKASQQGDPTKYDFPFTLSSYRDCNFSFSGLKAKALLYIVRREKELGIEADGILPDIYDICASFQSGVSKHLCRRVQRAMEYIERKQLIPEDKRTLVVSGGVACNSYIQLMLSKVCTAYGYRIAVPPPKLCTDNGVMIAWNGVEKWKIGCDIVDYTQLDTVDIQAKCKLGESLIPDVRSSSIKCTWVKLPER